MTDHNVSEDEFQEELKLSFWHRYIFSVDHKTIAKQYLFLGLTMAVVGGFLAYLMRSQLAWPGKPVFGWPVNEGYIDSPHYNALVTMHGTIMVFFVAMPILIGAFGNFLIPLMIGAPDMAFPRLNMMSFWTMFLATLVMIASFFVPGGAASAGWTGYVPLSADPIYTGVNWGLNFWILGLALEFVSVLMGGVNFLTTAITMRAPGMTLFRLPLMIWMQLSAAILFMLSVGPTIAAAVLLLLDRIVGTGFYDPGQGGDPLLWQHLFWFFGHPEVYVILLPAFGILLEILPVFSRKPIFAYHIIIYSTIIAGFLSFFVWAHHMFVSGMDPRLSLPFSITTILISVPFAIIIFAMIITLWRGSLHFSTAMLFTLGTLTTFILGGVTGIFNGSPAVDIYIHDTYFVVAHFHYTLFPSSIFATFAGIYFWFPKMFGRMMDETLGKIHFWMSFIFFNLTFLPMFALGMGGHMRRIADLSRYDFLKPLQPTHQFITVAAIVMGIGQIPFIVNFFRSLFAGELAEYNPWRANTLEWVTISPPPHGNFETIPTVYHGPYDYSLPEIEEDWLPQNQPIEESLLSTLKGKV